MLTQSLLSYWRKDSLKKKASACSGAIEIEYSKGIAIPGQGKWSPYLRNKGGSPVNVEGVNPKDFIVKFIENYADHF